MKKLMLGLCTLGMLAGSAPSLAATQCRNKAGKFVKCPSAKAAKPTVCRNAKGHFAKCK